MRRLKVAALAAAFSFIGTQAFAELQLLNNGTLTAAAAQAKFADAWKACTAEMKPGSSQDALFACINRKLKPYQITAVR